jgi:hypothetical protein
MAAIGTLSDPVIKKVVLHVFNKHRHDVAGKDGKLAANKKKYTNTCQQLESQYGLSVKHTWLKGKNVRNAASTSRRRPSSASLCFACLCAVRGFVQEELEACYDEAWAEDDEGYQTEGLVAQVMTLYPSAMPGGASARAAASPARSKGAAASSSPGPAAAAAVAARDQRHLSLIHGELCNISGSLRLLANFFVTGSRASVRQSLVKMMNSMPDEDESGQSAHTTSAAREELTGHEQPLNAVVLCQCVMLFV